MNTFARISTSTALVGAIVLGSAVTANAHGYVGNEKSDVVARAAMKANTDLGPIQWEPQSIEGPKGFSLDPATGGPADGKLASAGNHLAGKLDAQYPSRWVENEVQAGQVVNIGWKYTAPHRTSQWHYYITKNGWNQKAPLSRSTLQPLATVEHDGSLAPQGTAHRVALPADHTGNHVIYAVWDVADTSNAFYNVIDILIEGEAVPEVPETEAPSAPTGLRTANVTDRSAEITWIASTDNVGVERYEIQRATKSDEFKKVGSVTGTSFTDAGLAPLTAYRYRVVAIDAAGNTSDAGIAFVKTKSTQAQGTSAPSAPTGVHTMRVTADSVDLMWSESTDNVRVDHYEIQRAITGGAFEKVASTERPRTSTSVCAPARPTSTRSSRSTRQAMPPLPARP